MSRLRSFLSFSLVALSLASLVGCATTQQRDAAVPAQAERPIPATPDLASLHLDALEYSEGDEFLFVDGRTGEVMSFADVAARAAQVDVVLAGEQHDQASHHRLQARLAEAMAQGGGLTIGLEMVSWQRQAPLDRFGRGYIDVDGMFAALDWENTWGHNAELYREIFEQGRKGSARFVALNAPRELVRAVARKGVEGLSDEQRKLLPELDLDDEVHRGAIEGFFRQHHPPTASSADSFGRFYAAQVLWDESMAERSVAALDTDAQRVLVLAGVGHVAGYRGIPQRILRRRPEARLLTVVPLPVEGGEDLTDAVKQAIARGDADILAIKRPREVLVL